MRSSTSRMCKKAFHIGCRVQSCSHGCGGQVQEPHDHQSALASAASLRTTLIQPRRKPSLPLFHPLPIIMQSSLLFDRIRYSGWIPQPPLERDYLLSCSLWTASSISKLAPFPATTTCPRPQHVQRWLLLMLVISPAPKSISRRCSEVTHINTRHDCREHSVSRIDRAKSY